MLNSAMLAGGLDEMAVMADPRSNVAGRYLFEEGDFELENAELSLGDVTMVSPMHACTGFRLFHLPPQEIKLIGWSRIVHVEILLPSEPAGESCAARITQKAIC